MDKKKKSMTKAEKILAIFGIAMAAIYTYSLLARFFGYIAGVRGSIVIWICAALVTIGILSVAIYEGKKKWSFGITVILCYFLVTALFVQIFDLVLTAVVGEENLTIWKFIYSLLVIPFVVTLIMTIYGKRNMYDIRKRVYTVYTDRDIREEGYRILFVSDIHYGTALDNNDVTGFRNRLSKEDVDIVLLGGDIVDEHTKPEEVKRIFMELGKVRQRYGIFFVFGNHDRGEYNRSENAMDEKELKTLIENCGIKILDSETIDINEDLSVTGRDDRYYPHDEVDVLMKKTDPKRFRVFLDHQPYEMWEKSHAGVDLLLSGHTHDGQFFPVGYILKQAVEMDYGIEEIGKMTAIVSSGAGGGNIDMRTENHSEYVIVNVMREEYRNGLNIEVEGV